MENDIAGVGWLHHDPIGPRLDEDRRHIHGLTYASIINILALIIEDVLEHGGSLERAIAAANTASLTSTEFRRVWRKEGETVDGESGPPKLRSAVFELVFESVFGDRHPGLSIYYSVLTGEENVRTHRFVPSYRFEDFFAICYTRRLMLRNMRYFHAPKQGGIIRRYRTLAEYFFGNYDEFFGGHVVDSLLLYTYKGKIEMRKNEQDVLPDGVETEIVTGAELIGRIFNSAVGLGWTLQSFLLRDGTIFDHRRLYDAVEKSGHALMMTLYGEKAYVQVAIMCRQHPDAQKWLEALDKIGANLFARTLLAVLEELRNVDKLGIVQQRELAVRYLTISFREARELRTFMQTVHETLPRWTVELAAQSKNLSPEQVEAIAWALSYNDENARVLFNNNPRKRQWTQRALYWVGEWNPPVGIEIVERLDSEMGSD